MGMELRMELRKEQRPPIIGGLTGSVFTKTAKKLIDNPKYLKRITYFTRYKDMSIYRSVIDFLLCKVYPFSIAEKCFFYYADKGPKFCEDPDTIGMVDGFNPYDFILSELVLEICIGDFGITPKGNKRRGSWNEVLYVVQYFMDDVGWIPHWTEGRSPESIAT